MKRWAVGAAIAVGLMLTGCSAIDEGVITAKVYEEESTYYTTDCKAWRTTAQGGMVCSFYGPTYHHDDADWRFDLRKGEDEGWVYVTPETYEMYEVGDYWKEPK